MTLGLYDYDRRYRRRFWAGFFKFILFLALLLGVGIYAYQIGVEQFKERDAAQRQEAQDLKREKDKLELMARQLRQAQLNADAKVRELETRLANELPQGDLAELVKLLAQRLSAGVSPGRLGFVISQAQEQRTCSQQEMKRFRLGTPLFPQTGSAASFAGGTLSVVGSGKSAVDGNGRPEAWFDPAHPVQLVITAHGGKPMTAEGMLPLHQSVVVGDSEFRLTAVPGPRSFVEVTADRCPYP